MLTFITDITNPIIEFLKDDPVRPEIPAEFRVSENRFISSIVDGEDPKAIVCVSLCDQVPASVAELAQDALMPNTAIFYTIWRCYQCHGRAYSRTHFRKLCRNPRYQLQ